MAQQDIDFGVDPDIMTPEEVAQYLRKSLSWIYRNWQMLGGVKLGRKNLTKGVLQDFDSGQKAVPGSLQAASLDQPRRRIQPSADPRLGVEESLQASDLQGTVSQPRAGQHRDGVTAAHAEKTLDPEALGARGFAEAPIEPVTMQPPRASPWAVRAIPFEALSPNLNPPLRTALPPELQVRLSP